MESSILSERYIVAANFLHQIGAAGSLASTNIEFPTRKKLVNHDCPATFNFVYAGIDPNEFIAPFEDQLQRSLL